MSTPNESDPRTQGEAARLREAVDLAFAVIGGNEWEESSCQCNPSVGMVPCHYCALHRGLSIAENVARCESAAVAAMRAAAQEAYEFLESVGPGEDDGEVESLETRTYVLELRGRLEQALATRKPLEGG